MAGLRIEGDTSGVVAEVTPKHSLKVAGEVDSINNPDNIGSFKMYSELDGGLATGVYRLLSGEVSEDFRQRTELDSLLDVEKFNYTAQNTSKHTYTNTTLTNSWTTGALITNSGAITTAASGSKFSTYKTFATYSASETYAYFKMAIAGTWAVSNTTVDIGFFTPGAALPYAPTDGIFIRITSAGLQLVSNVNGTEAVGSVILTNFAGTAWVPTIGTFYDFILTASDTAAVLWLDRRDNNPPVQVSRLIPALATGVNFSQSNIPFSIRHSIGATAASAAMSVKIANYTVTQGGVASNRLWATAMVGMGGSGIQGQSGAIIGSTANVVNSTAPVAAALSNATAGYTTLGGQFSFATVAGSETDYALFSYLVPASAPSVSGKSLFIRGIWIDSTNTGAAVATTPTMLQWAIAVGSTAVSLGTTESQNTRSPKRLTLGNQSFLTGAAIGTIANVIDKNMDAALIAEPGTYVHVIVKLPIGTATAGQVIRGIVGLNAFWE